MSTAARVAIGVAMLLGAVCFAAIGVTLGGTLPAGPWPFYGSGLFCGVVALACLARKSQPVTLRIIGLVIFVVYACSSRGDKSFSESILGLLLIGLPCAYLAVTGRYPSWGRWAGAFDSQESENRTADEGQERPL